MLRVRDIQRKILQSVIIADAIDVVHDFVRRKHPSEVFRNDVAMLQESAVLVGHRMSALSEQYVPGIEGPSATGPSGTIDAGQVLRVPLPVALLITEIMRLERRAVPMERFPARVTRDGYPHG